MRPLPLEIAAGSNLVPIAIGCALRCCSSGRLSDVLTTMTAFRIAGSGPSGDRAMTGAAPSDSHQRAVRERATSGPSAWSRRSGPASERGQAAVAENTPSQHRDAGAGQSVVAEAK